MNPVGERIDPSILPHDVIESHEYVIPAGERTKRVS